MSSIEKVIDGGYCIGCGVCAHVQPSKFGMEMSDEGMWVARVDTNSRVDTNQGDYANIEDLGKTICPMSGETPDESAIAGSLFPSLPVDAAIGRYRRNVAGHVATGDYRAIGGSGGLVTWLLSELLTRGEVDAVLHVRAVKPENDGVLFEYSISETHDQIVSAAKSRYYPIETSGVLDLLNESDRRYAFVGVPCFIKAVRLLQINGFIAEDRVRYCVGLVCGHLKSRYFAEYLAWQKGILPSDLAAIDYRHKLLDAPASRYGFSVTRRLGENGEVYPMTSVKGRDWGEGLFKNPACEFCDDVLAECADIAVGDAWLPEYVDDPRGTNVAVVRNEFIDLILREAQTSGALSLEDVTPEQVAKSQDGGLRHRRRGLSHRLARRQEQGVWAPKKRVPAVLESDKKRRKVYDARLQIAEKGSRLFAIARRSGDLHSFEQAMAPLILEYRQASRESLLRRAAKSVRNALKARGYELHHLRRITDLVKAPDTHRVLQHSQPDSGTSVPRTVDDSK